SFFSALRPWPVASVVALFVLFHAAAPAAHDIPNDVTVQAFLKPEGKTLRLLVRVPLLAMRDMDYPKRRGATSADLVDLSRADAGTAGPSHRDGAALSAAGRRRPRL